MYLSHLLVFPLFCSVEHGIKRRNVQDRCTFLISFLVVCCVYLYFLCLSQGNTISLPNSRELSVSVNVHYKYFFKRSCQDGLAKCEIRIPNCT